MSAEYGLSTLQKPENSNNTIAERKARKHLAEQALMGGFIPLGEVQSGYEDLRHVMLSRIIGQPTAIDEIIDALDRAEVRLPEDKKPIATLAFLGPTGVGKSETAKALAEFLAIQENTEINLIKINCSEYSNGHEVSSLTGAPPGYIGRDQVAHLAKQNVEKPATVVLFDELEKGAKPLHDLMLQIMEDGELRLNDGGTVIFRDAFVIMTSNLGAEEMSYQLEGRRAGFGVVEREVTKSELEKISTKAFKAGFVPEFSNRIDKLVVFHPLDNGGLLDVLNMKVERATRYYEDEFGVRMSLSDQTKNYLIDIANLEPNLGARPLTRALDSEIKATFSKYISSGDVKTGTHVHVFHRDEVPEQYLTEENQQYVFASKQDASIVRKEKPEVIVQAVEFNEGKAVIIMPKEEDESELAPESDTEPEHFVDPEDPKNISDEE